MVRLSIVLGILTGVPVFAQSVKADVQLVHAEGGTEMAFEVATIKPDSDLTTGIRAQLSPAHFSMTHASFADLIKFAYGVRSDDQIVGLSGWMRTERFNIQAKSSDKDIAAYDKLDFDGELTMPRLLLQSLLHDRFQLKAKVETRELKVYVLVVVKGGIKMKKVQEGAPLPDVSRMRMTGSNQFTAAAWPFSQMAEWLAHFYEVGDRPVVDRTGLGGNYDFVLDGVSMTRPLADHANGSGTQEPISSIFAALPEQLGLKLEPRTAPVEVLVIDHVEAPSAN